MAVQNNSIGSSPESPVSKRGETFVVKVGAREDMHNQFNMLL